MKQHVFCHFTKYGFYGSDDESNIMVISVTPADIESGELLSLLKKAEMNKEMASEEGILIFRKGE